MTWRLYFWPCAFFFLLGTIFGFGSGAIAYKYRRPLLRMPGRLASSVARITKPSSISLQRPPKVNKDGSLVIASFESANELRLFGDSEAKLERSTNHPTDGAHSLRVTFPDGGGALSAWRTLPSDWSGYDRFKFDVYSPKNDVPLSLFIKDSINTSYRKRYNLERIRLRTGLNVIDIPLSGVALRINLRDIVQLRVFLWKVPGQHVLYFDNFRLERDGPAAAEQIPEEESQLAIGNPSQSPALVKTSNAPMKPNVWVVSESYKIRPDEGTPYNPYVKRNLREQNEIWDGTKRLINLNGARNEYVGFQVIIEAGNTPLEGVTVVASDLAGPSTISRHHIKLFREHYVNATKSSDWPQPSTGPGEYPDPLIPLDLPSAGGPFDVPPGRNQAVWIDIYIPATAPAGLYSGRITVIGNGFEPLPFSVQLKVWNFALPQESHLTFWTNYYDLPRGFDVTEGSSEHLAVERDLWRLGHRHRITALLRLSPARPHYAGSGKSLQVDWISFDLRVGPYLDGTVFVDGVRPNLFLLPITYAEGKQWPPGDDETFFQMCKEFARHFDAKGWDLSKTLIYLGDEPKEQEFQTIKRLARLVRQADPRFKTTVAFIKLPASLLQEFDGLVDLWMVDAGAYSSRLLAPRKAKGELTGFYQQSEPYVGNETLDSDGLALRTWPWIAWKYRVDVIYLYSMTEWWLWRKGNNPWVNPLTRGQTNSQGILIYPGRHLNTRRVIGSIRMKQIRRGMQDYEYLYLAKAAGADTAQVVNTIIRRALDETRRGWGSPGEWERDPAKWLEARKKIATLILRHRRQQPQAATTERRITPPPPAYSTEVPSNVLLKVDFEMGTKEGWEGGKVQDKLVYKGRYGLQATPKSGESYQWLELWRRFPTTSNTVLKFAFYSKRVSWVKVQSWSRDRRRNFAKIFNNPKESQWHEVSLPLSDMTAKGKGSLAGDTINSIHFAIPNRPGAVLVVDDVVLFEETENARGAPRGPP